nr:hypothetical protein [uncultured Psychroserpens sp.]
MIRRIILILFLINFSKSNSQIIAKKIGDIKITEIGYSINEKNKRKKISKSEFYFDNSGNILEAISYGRHHYNKLNVVGTINQFYYKDGKLVMSKKYKSSCKSCEFYSLYTKYDYDFNDRLIVENKYYEEDDSLSASIKYIHTQNTKETHQDTSTYLQEVYDSENKIIELNQRFEDTKKIRWQYLYDYIDNCRIGNFQTYYEDGDQNSKKEIYCYDSEKRLISKEIISNYKTKIEYSYSDKGFVNEVKEFQCFDESDNYELKYIIKFKIKLRIDKSKIEILKKINAELIGE